MANFDDVMTRMYQGFLEPVEDDAIRFVLILPGIAAFFQDYTAEGIWKSVDLVKEQNSKTATREDWITCLYAEAATLFTDQTVAERIQIIQQTMLINVIVHTYEPQVFEREDMRVAILLMNPPPGTDGYRYYLDKNNVHQTRVLVEGFLERKGATVQ